MLGEVEVDVFDAFELAQDRHLVASGVYSQETVMAQRAARRHKETLKVCAVLAQSHAWDTDLSCTPTSVYISWAQALDGLYRRHDAIEKLASAVSTFPNDCHLQMALARLLFRAGRKTEAARHCLTVCAAATSLAVLPSLRDASHTVTDAFHLAGWVLIHSDNHTAAYDVWRQGHAVVPSCPVLARLNRKRVCWDAVPDKAALLPNLVGSGAHGDGNFNTTWDLEAFAVSATHAHAPALALFAPEQQQGRLVWRTRNALLTSDECAHVRAVVDAHHRDKCGGRWGTVRHSSVKTTDCAVEDIAILRPWLQVLLATRIYPFLSAAFPMLADGSSTNDPCTGASRLRVHDAFIVRYDAEHDGSISLPEHHDTSALSVVLSLNSSTCYNGGGTWFEALRDVHGLVVNANEGCAVGFAGPLRHAGFPISSGLRLILVLFLYVDNFAYGPLISAANQASPALTSHSELPTAGARPSGDATGGFVVYNQTVELVDVLNRDSAVNDEQSYK